MVAKKNICQYPLITIDVLEVLLFYTFIKML